MTVHEGCRTGLAVPINHRIALEMVSSHDEYNLWSSHRCAVWTDGANRRCLNAIPAGAATEAASDRDDTRPPLNNPCEGHTRPPSLSTQKNDEASERGGIRARNPYTIPT